MHFILDISISEGCGVYNGDPYASLPEAAGKRTATNDPKVHIETHRKNHFTTSSVPLLWSATVWRIPGEQIVYAVPAPMASERTLLLVW
jgi:hypothetical protein